MKTITAKDIVNGKDGTILFSCKEENRIKYISKDNGYFMIWTTESNIEVRSKLVRLAVKFYNNPDKYLYDNRTKFKTN